MQLIIYGIWLHVMDFMVSIHIVGLKRKVVGKFLAALVRHQEILKLLREIISAEMLGQIIASFIYNLFRVTHKGSNE